MSARTRAIKSDVARIDKLRDEEIDYSDIPELDDEVFAQPLVAWPPRKESITIRVDPDVLDWFKDQGRSYQTRINQVLRRYMDVAQERVRPPGRKQPKAPARTRRAR